MAVRPGRRRRFDDGRVDDGRVDDGRFARFLGIPPRPMIALPDETAAWDSKWARLVTEWNGTLEELKRDGLIDGSQLRSDDFAFTAVTSTGRGRAWVEDRRARQAAEQQARQRRQTDPAQRARACRIALLRWLYERHIARVLMPRPADFAKDDAAKWEGDRFTDVEIEDAAKYLSGGLPRMQGVQHCCLISGRDLVGRPDTNLSLNKSAMVAQAADLIRQPATSRSSDAIPEGSRKYRLAVSSRAWPRRAWTWAGSATPVNGWTLGFSFGGDQRITQSWNAGFIQSSAAVTLRDAGWNTTLPAGGSTSLGVLGTWAVSTAPPAAYTLNGAPCTVG